MKEVVIVGGGIAGLTAAYNLLKRDEEFNILLVEKSQRLGGLAKSFRYDDKFIFDIGPKRFHTEDEVVIKFIHEIGRDVGLMKIGRSSKVLFLDRFFSWPLGRKDLLKLPLWIAGASIRDLLFKKKFTAMDLLKFENYITSRYGKTLYDIFFKPYTEKFLRTKADYIHADWASTGINRSIINRENKGNSFVELVQQVLLPPQVKANFLYPEKGGFGYFWDACAQLVSNDPNARIETGKTVDMIHKGKDCLVLNLSDGSQVSCDYLLWSGRLPDLLECIVGQDSKTYNLPYVDTVFVDLVFTGNAIINKAALCQWLYISSSGSDISRVSFPKEFNGKNIPEGYEGLCVEVTCKETEKKIDEEQIAKAVIEELYMLKVLSEDAKVYCKNMHRESSTYPVYHAGYKEETEKAFKTINGFSSRIIPFGRSGSFWYNNADHSIRQALALTDDLIEGRHPEFDFRKYFGGISEELNRGV